LSHKPTHRPKPAKECACPDAEKEKHEPPTKNLIISTTVKYNNWFGKIYFLPVKPFHKRIVPTMLKGIIKEIEKETTTNN